MDLDASPLLGLLLPNTPSPSCIQRGTAYGLLLVFEDYIKIRSCRVRNNALKLQFAPKVFEIFWDIFAPRVFGFEYSTQSYKEKNCFIGATDELKKYWKVPNYKLSTL